MIDTERYSRQIMIPEIGTDGQTRLAQASVLIVGVGGLGSPVATYLAAAGIGRLGLCDNDVVSLSNLQRQILYTSEQIGVPKPDAAYSRLSAMVPELKIDKLTCLLTEENATDIISGYDLIIDCSDNFPTRYVLDDACYELGKTWVYGGVGAFNGQVAVLNGRAGVRYSMLYPDREALCGRERVTAGVIGPLPGVIGAIQATEAIKIIAGFGQPLDGRLMTINLLTNATEIIDLK